MMDSAVGGSAVRPGCVDDDELVRLAHDMLDDTRALAVRAHLDECSDCRDAAAVAKADDLASGVARSHGATGPGASLGAPLRVDVGETLDGRFRILREIGRGGMGVVYAAIHLSLQRTVAIKVMRGEVAEDDECVRRFLRETRLIARLTSPHVVRVFDVGRLRGGDPYMVMELLEGSDIERMILRFGPLEPDVATDYLLQGCHAIGEAHAAGIVHRDIKLANLFLAESHDRALVKVLDFGLAKGSAIFRTDHHVTNVTNVDAVMGTPHYMSPEQLAAARDVDARADVWSLGVALYRMLTGAFPFHGPDFVSLRSCILHGTLERPTKRRAAIPLGLEEVVLKCLARDPMARFADANELARAVRRAVGNGAQVVGAPAVRPSPVEGSLRSTDGVDVVDMNRATGFDGAATQPLPPARPRPRRVPRTALISAALPITLLLVWLGSRSSALDSKLERGPAKSGVAAGASVATTTPVEEPAPSAAAVREAPPASTSLAAGRPQATAADPVVRPLAARRTRPSSGGPTPVLPPPAPSTSASAPRERFYTKM